MNSYMPGGGRSSSLLGGAAANANPYEELLRLKGGLTPTPYNHQYRTVFNDISDE